MLHNFVKGVNNSFLFAFLGLSKARSGIFFFDFLQITYSEFFGLGSEALGRSWP